MVWKELAVALCMVLVIEGILPFLSPRRWRSVAELAGRVDDQTVLAPVETDAGVPPASQSDAHRSSLS